MQKTKRLPKWKWWKKYHFGGRNDGIWPKNDEPLMESYLLTHFQSISCTNLSETEFWHTKKWAPKQKFLKNAISYTETIEFGWKTMILQGSPSHWPISNRKVALIFLNLNSGNNNKTSTETKILKKMPCRRAKQLNLAEKQWTSYEVLSVDLFPIEKLHRF